MRCRMMETIVSIIGAVATDGRGQCFRIDADASVTTACTSHFDRSRFTHYMNDIQRTIYLQVFPSTHRSECICDFFNSKRIFIFCFLFGCVSNSFEQTQRIAGGRNGMVCALCMDFMDLSEEREKKKTKKQK